MAFVSWTLLMVTTPGVRFVDVSSCDVARVNLSVGMSTQIIFEEVPTVTYNGDEQNFKVRSTEDVPRSIVITPTITSESLAQSMSTHGVRSEQEMMSRLDRTYSTNLFVFFKNANQLLFQLHFVDKQKADNIVRVHQVFKKDCNL